MIFFQFREPSRQKQTDRTTWFCHLPCLADFQIFTIARAAIVKISVFCSLFRASSEIENFSNFYCSARELGKRKSLFFYFFARAQRNWKSLYFLLLRARAATLKIFFDIFRARDLWKWKSLSVLTFAVRIQHPDWKLLSVFIELL